ncbi:MAG: Gldg family protein, partial [Planctomycetota bacterium]
MSSPPAEGWRIPEKAAVVINVLLAVVVVVEAVFIGNRIYGRWDLTQDRAFTISPRTISFLESLEQPVKAHVFYSKDHPNHAWAWQRIHDLLEEFQLQTRYLDVIYHEPYRNPAGAAQMRQKFGISPNDFVGGVVVFEFGDKSQYLPDARIVEYAATPGAPVPDKMRGKKTFHGEDAFLATLYSLVEGEKAVAYVLAGHGEAGIEDQRGEGGFYHATMLLRGDGYEVRPLRFGGGELAVPDDADLVIIAGPRVPIPNPDIHALVRYAERGGKLLVLPSFQLQEGETTPTDMNLKPLLDHFEVELGTRLLVEDEARYRPSYIQVLSTTLFEQDHPATRPLGEGEEKICVFSAARALRSAGKKAVPLVFSTPTTVEKGDLTEILNKELYNNLLKYNQSLFNPEKDRRERFPLVVASEIPGKRPELNARAVVAGSMSFVSNIGLTIPSNNKDLFLNLVNWLTKRESHMGIAAKADRAVFYHVRPKTNTKVFLLVLVFLPLTALAAGGWSGSV